MIDEKLEPNGVVISSRIRLARNIAEFPFVNTCSNDQKQQIESTIRSSLEQDSELNELSVLDAEELEALERQFLLDLHQVSLSASGLKSGANESSTEHDSDSDSVRETNSEGDSTCLDTLPNFDDVSLTVNEEDHLRITITRPDLDLDAAWNEISQLDDMIEQHLNYAFSPRWGYLTACPANVGTGMRVSVLVHLPALVLTGQIDKVFRGIQRVNVVARQVFGDRNDRAVGDYFRITNQSTLGINETELIEQVTTVIPALIKYECEAREFLLAESREGLLREVTEASNRLSCWDLEDSDEKSNDEVMELISKVRMGLGMGLLKPSAAGKINRLFALVHLRHGLLAAIAKEDYRRASKLRDRILELEQADFDEGGPR